MTEAPPAEKKPRSKRIYVYWGVALTLLLVLYFALGREWFCIWRLNSSSSYSQVAAARKLGQMKSKRAVPYLIEHLDDGGHSRATVNCTVAIALGRIGDRRAVDPLIQIIRKSRNEVPNGDRLRACAARALGMLGDPRAIGPLRELLSDTGYSVGGNAWGALVELGVKPEEVRKARFEALMRVLRQSEDARAREEAVSLLELMELPAAIPALYGALGDKAEHVRISAYHSLLDLGEPKDKVHKQRHQGTVVCLTDTDALVRLDAVEGLWRIGTAEDVSILTEALRDSDKRVRGSAADALGRIGAPAAIPALRAIKSDPDSDVRRSAILSLADLKDKTVIPDLKRLYETYPAANDYWITERLKKLGLTQDEIAKAKADARSRKAQAEQK